MYLPHFNRMPDDDVAAFLDAVATAELVTVGADGYPESTLLPFLRDGDRLLMHMARANEQWRDIEPDTPALAIVGGPNAYVSPAWYATKAEHGRVVPTWNYSTVHVYGRVTAHHEASWLRDVVQRLTERHEHARPEPWSITDAPADYIDKQLRAIVGVELQIERVEAKAKLSQNRSDEDRRGVIAGLETEGGALDAAVAGAMRALDVDADVDADADA